LSEFQVEVIRISEIIEHQNADALEVVMNGLYPVCVRKGEFKIGDTAIYIPIDAEVPVDESEFSFLKKSISRTHERIKAKRLRGVFSMGLLVPNKRGFSVGQNVQEEMKVLKWEEPMKLTQQGNAGKDVGYLPHYDIESIRKWSKIINLGEDVIITEKLHGTNFGAVWSSKDELFYVKSHKLYRERMDTDLWWRIAEQYNLEEKLKRFPDIGIYGEIYGSVQSLKYGHKQGKCSLRIFDAFNINTHTWFSEDEFSAFADALELDRTPILYKGIWQGYEWCKNTFACGNSTLADNMREGCVVHTRENRRHQLAGRVKLKVISEEYQLKKK